MKKTKRKLKREKMQLTRKRMERRRAEARGGTNNEEKKHETDLKNTTVQVDFFSAAIFL